MKEDDMKIIDFLKLIKDIQLWKVTKITNAAFEEFKKQTDEVREVIKQLLVVSEHEEQSSWWDWTVSCLTQDVPSFEQQYYYITQSLWFEMENVASLQQIFV